MSCAALSSRCERDLKRVDNLIKDVSDYQHYNGTQGAVKRLTEELYKARGIIKEIHGRAML